MFKARFILTQFLGSTQTKKLADVYAGCTAETLTLSNSGVDINFEITFRAMTVTPPVDTQLDRNRTSCCL